MDKLSELPPTETQLTPQENQVMKKYFGDGETPPEQRMSWASIFKLALYATILFLALSNPITDGIFSKIPYCGEGIMTLLATKAIVFMFLFIVIYKFL